MCNQHCAIIYRAGIREDRGDGANVCKRSVRGESLAIAPVTLEMPAFVPVTAMPIIIVVAAVPAIFPAAVMPAAIMAGSANANPDHHSGGRRRRRKWHQRH